MVAQKQSELEVLRNIMGIGNDALRNDNATGKTLRPQTNEIPPIVHAEYGNKLVQPSAASAQKSVRLFAIPNAEEQVIKIESDGMLDEDTTIVDWESERSNENGLTDSVSSDPLQSTADAELEANESLLSSNNRDGRPRKNHDAAGNAHARKRGRPSKAEQCLSEPDEFLPTHYPILPGMQEYDTFMNDNSNYDLFNGIQRLECKLDSNKDILVNILRFVANFDKTMDVHGASTSWMDEDFTYLKKRFENVDELKSFEAELAAGEYFDKFIRFIKTQFELTGKRDGGMIFRTIIRRLVDSSVFVCYSWKGQSRTPKTETSEAVSRNASFRSTYPNFIRLMYKICSMADVLFTLEKTESEFCKVLRYKNKHLQRDAERNDGTLSRASSSRFRKTNHTISNVNK